MELYVTVLRDACKEEQSAGSGLGQSALIALWVPFVCRLVRLERKRPDEVRSVDIAGAPSSIIFGAA